MTRYIDIRMSSSAGWLNTVRRIEYVTLLAISAAAVLLFEPHGPYIAAPLLLLALALVPRSNAAPARERQRMDTLNQLQSDGLGLRSRWLTLTETPLNDETAVEHWRVQRDTLIWLSSCSGRLGRFPELAGIFNAHAAKDSLLEELDLCLHTLSRLRRLLNLSQNLKLPI
jgi:hypothetical protein